MPRMHDKEHFFKYMTANTAKAVLENSSMRWRSPSLFNDPFDHQISFSYPFTYEEFESRIIEKLIGLIFSDKAIEFEKVTPLSKNLDNLRNLKNSHTENNLKQILIESIKETLDTSFKNYKNELHKTVTETSKYSRILCISETNSNVVMWSHYADEHSGVCLKLKCTEEFDNAILAAKPIKYVEDAPLFITLEEFTDLIIGLKDISINDDLLNLAFIKHKDWEYEKEWRVYLPLEEDYEGYTDYGENPATFDAIYLGCRMDQKTEQELIELIERSYPNMEIFRTEKKADSFKLEYTKIK